MSAGKIVAAWMLVGAVLTMGVPSFFGPSIAQAQESETESPESSESPTSATEPPVGSFIDRDGEVRSFEETYESWFRGRRGEPRYGLAALENAATLVIGLTYYWLRTDVQRTDWDRPSISDRFTLSAWRFDNNSNLFNHIFHPFGGANYYGLARINNLNVLESSLYSAGASFFWEFALEWRELVSINDLIFTPISGIAVGEFLFQLGEYATSTPSSKPWHPVGAYTFGLYRKLHDPFFKNHERIRLPGDGLGYSSAFWHEFHVAGEYLSVSTEAARDTLYGLRASAKLVSIPGFAQPGEFDLRFAQGNFTDGKVDISLGAGGRFDTDLFFSASLLGKYSQAYRRHGQDTLRGHASLIGLTTAFRFSDHSFSASSDQIAVAHAAGPRLSGWYEYGDFHANVDFDSTVDFAAIRSLAFEDWRQGRDVSGVKSVLIDKNYQYHYGASARTSLAVNYAGVGIELKAAAGRYASLQGYDRFEENVTADVSGTENIYEYGGALQLGVPSTAAVLEVGVKRFGRISAISQNQEDVELARWDTRTTVSLGAVF